MKKLIFTAYVLLFGFSLQAYGSIKLYENYTFGMPRGTIAKIKGVYDCSRHFEGGGLCLNDQKFYGLEAIVAFDFLNDKLKKVHVIIPEYEKRDVMRIPKEVFTGKFQMLILFKRSGEQFDILQHAHSLGKDMTGQMMLSFMLSGMNEDDYMRMLFAKITKDTDQLLLSSHSLPDFVRTYIKGAWG